MSLTAELSEHKKGMQQQQQWQQQATDDDDDANEWMNANDSEDAANQWHFVTHHRCLDDDNQAMHADWLMTAACMHSYLISADHRLLFLLNLFLSLTLCSR